MTDQEKGDNLLAAMRRVVTLERQKLALDHELAIARVTLQEAKDQAYVQDRLDTVIHQRRMR